MAPELQRITDEILSMPASSRALLARRLLESLSPPDSEAIEQSWALEAEERLRQIDAGEVEALDGADVLQELRTLCR